MTTKPRLVSCPQCSQLVPYDTGNPYRPFCSKRCQMIDLGAWASESYRIPEAPKPEDDDLQQIQPE